MNLKQDQHSNKVPLSGEGLSLSNKKPGKMEKKEFRKSEVFQNASLVQYPEEAVISRTLLNRKSGTVTVFAFDKGQGLSTHTAPFDALIQIVDGLAKITIGEQDYELQGGDSIIMPANIPHSVFASEKFKMLLTMIKSID